MSEKTEVVCVTGASGCIGSWVVHLLLLRGYTVHATVEDPNDKKETEHLKGMEGASTRLHLFQMELLDYDSVLAAIEGCVGVFHIASPCILRPVEDPQRQLLDPAVKGTMNVLMASKEAGVRRVVLTSSVVAIWDPSTPLNEVINESCWSDEEFCKQNGMWYSVAKTRAEKAAWKFAEEKGLDVVVVNPSMVLGPLIPPTLNSSMGMLLALLRGTEEEQDFSFYASCVHFRDVAQAHILLYENSSAKGRHICARTPSPDGDFLSKLSELYPEWKIKLKKDMAAEPLREGEASRKLIDLGLKLTPMEQIIRDSVESLKSKGFLS